MEQYTKTERNTVKRVPKRGHYDKATVYKVLDAGFIAHVGFSMDGQPFVIPTAYGRKGDQIYLHGATTSRMIQHLQGGAPVCLTVTFVDGVVLACVSENRATHKKDQRCCKSDGCDCFRKKHFVVAKWKH